MEGQQPQPVQDLDKVLGRIQDIVCTQLNAFKREIRDDQEEALSGDMKKLEVSGKLVCNKKSNEMNFKSFGAVDGSLDDAWASLEKRNLEQVQESLEEGKRLISERMKEIPQADKHGWEFVHEYQSQVVIFYVSSHLLQVFLPLILAISLLSCATAAAKTAIIG